MWNISNVTNRHLSKTFNENIKRINKLNHIAIKNQCLYNRQCGGQHSYSGTASLADSMLTTQNCCLFSMRKVSNGHMLLESQRFFSAGVKTIKVPSMGDSITEGTLAEWKKNVGDFVAQDELIAVIDTDKISVDINCSENGKLIAQHADAGAVVLVGDKLYDLELGGVAPDAATTPSSAPTPEATSTPSFSSSKQVPQAVSKASVPVDIPAAPSSPKAASTTTSSPVLTPTPTSSRTGGQSTPSSASNSYVLSTERKEDKIAMNRLRKRVAERLKTAQNTAASLTTFNECDMGNLMAMRSELQEAFVARHSIKLGFMSPFLYASAQALIRMPQINAYISESGQDIIYKNYADISVAVATPTGLLVPVIRDCDKKSIAMLESDLAAYASKAREGKIALEDMAGGTFTISNGGVFGSLMGTPILNYPQSSILGLHSIKERPVVKNGSIVIRPMMYLALTYDHRIVDGREAVTFLNLIKENIEDPRRLLLNI